MNDPLREIQEILDDLDNNLAEMKASWKQIEIDNPGFDQVSEENWNIRFSRSWLHGATEDRESNRLECWLSEKPQLTLAAQMPAKKAYRAWREWLETKGPLHKRFRSKRSILCRYT